MTIFLFSKKIKQYICLSIFCLSALLIFSYFQNPKLVVNNIWNSYKITPPSQSLHIIYPLNNTLFPPDITPPTLVWKDPAKQSDAWIINIQWPENGSFTEIIKNTNKYKILAHLWKNITSNYIEESILITVIGFNKKAPLTILSASTITINISKDPVNDSIFYREVKLPFSEAFKDLPSLRWRLGSISTNKRPKVVLKNLNLCGNCHTFSADGKTMGVELDWDGNKSGFALSAIKKEMIISDENIILWDNYESEKKEPTLGSAGTISPNNKYVASTVNDQVISIIYDDVSFSQKTFLTKGILCIYDREGKNFFALSGADDQKYVHCNPNWSPDGKYLVYMRALAKDFHKPGTEKKVMYQQDALNELLKERQNFQYDLYKIPFNNGKGGISEPIKGASSNGKSNYFPRYSPDGKWIVFCQSENFALLQPDSKLCIIPAEGGVARELKYNTPRMNSWHSWSSNSKWLVFSSKWQGPYTQLYLTHIDENGKDSPPVLLENFITPERAANIPEFVPFDINAINRIRIIGGTKD